MSRADLWEQVLGCVSEHGPVSARGIARRVHRRQADVRTALSALQEANQVTWSRAGWERRGTHPDAAQTGAESTTRDPNIVLGVDTFVVSPLAGNGFDEAMTRGQITNDALTDALTEGPRAFTAVMHCLTWQDMGEALAQLHISQSEYATDDGSET